MADALEQYVIAHGGVHDDLCPEDDTCECSLKWMNDGVNSACRFIRALSQLQADPALPPEPRDLQSDRDELLTMLTELYALIPDCDEDYLLDGRKGEFALKAIRVPGIGAACQKARAVIDRFAQLPAAPSALRVTQKEGEGEDESRGGTPAAVGHGDLPHRNTGDSSAEADFATEYLQILRSLNASPRLIAIAEEVARDAEQRRASRKIVSPNE